MTELPNPLADQRAVVDAYNQMAAARQPVRDNWIYMTSKQLTDFALLDEAAIDGANVLNVGCFYPIDEIMFVHRVKRWTATDLGEETIRVAQVAAREALSDELFSRLEFAVADGTALPFEDAVFDVVVSMSTVDHVPDATGRQRFINEMARVARPGGRIVLTVPNRWSRSYARRVKLVEPRNAHSFYEYCFSPLEFRRMVASAGLDICRFTSSSEVPALAPRPFLPRIDRRPLLTTWNTVARYFGARMGILAIRD
jgi:SAM-dependent methyltransferase